jgi:hypothetical protein
MVNDDKRMLELLHSQLIGALLQRIAEGTATAADLSVARQFLKDNGIDLSARHSEPMQRLHQALPFDVLEDEDE